MGLTINYDLKFSGTIKEATAAVSALRQGALDLPFQNVSEIVTFKGNEADFKNSDRDDEFRWMKIQSSQYARTATTKHGYREMTVAPLMIIGFATDPGEGCEEANFGLCRYPKTVKYEQRVIRTGLSEWSWKFFCKTQYANNPECGGIENFLSCHLSVIALIDTAKELGLLSEASDDSGYYETRNLKELVEEIADWDANIAGMTKAFSFLAGSEDMSAPIRQYRNFEELVTQANGNPDIRAILESLKAAKQAG